MRNRKSIVMSSTCPILFLLLLTITTFSVIVLCNHPSLAIPVDHLGPGKSISGNQTLLSNGGTYKMGFFFTPGRSNRFLYLGIWYNRISPRTVVWVANRESPVNTTAGILLTLTRDGNLMVKDGSTVIWSTGTANLSSPVARLMDSGNLVVSDRKSTYYSWQSFDHPTDTMLPDMKIGIDLRTGRSIKLTSWRSEDDPAPGDYSIGIDVTGVPELILYRHSNPLWRLGPWTGEFWSGFPQGTTPFRNQLSFSYSSTKYEVSYVFRTITNGTLTNMVVNQTGGKISRRLALSATHFNSFPDPVVICSYYRKCGAYSICSGSETTYECRCLKGFTNIDDGNTTGTGYGCRRISSLDCQGGTDKFEHIGASKLPETSKASVLEDIVGLEDCKALCLFNCSCTAYASSNFRRKSGCLMWFGDLQDISLQSENSQDWYLRLASIDSETAKKSSKKKSKAVAIVPVVVSAIVGFLLFGCVIAFFSLRRRKRKTTGVYCGEGYEDDDDINLPIFDFTTISIVTNNFSDENKLGEGGFGPVYKGRLTNDQLVAVKRLSIFSAQGLAEFKNEVRFITKLQHRNLVRLLGCCIHGGERMLIYEYMPNKSLDYLLFDKKREKSVDWQTRYKIIVGITRGLLYLHQDSRLTIVHRDIKAANILLDTNMNPKVSDFGTARAFAGNSGDSTSNTSKVIGTSEYMSPEYVLDGVFSMKSDVFSFGVLLLEIVSGVKNKSIFYADTQHNLINHAWSLWEEGKALDFIDQSIPLPFAEDEVYKCIKIGLLCVQEQPEDRPLMSMIDSMLGRVDVKSIKDPKKPKYMKMKVANETGTSMSYSGNNFCTSTLF